VKGHKFVRFVACGRFRPEWSHSRHPEPKEVSLYVNQRPDRYGSSNPPPTIKEAEARIEELSGNIENITSQLQRFDARLKDPHEDHDDVRARKNRAGAAKGHMNSELIFLKRWVKAEQRRRLQELVIANGVDPTSALSLLAASYLLLKRLQDEQVDFDPEELALIQLMKQHVFA